MDIRFADISEQKELENFLVSNFSERVRQLAQSYINCMFSSDYRKPSFLVAVENGQLIGALAFTEEFFTIDVWGISWVCVRESYRRTGVAERLVVSCLDEINKRMADKATVILCSYPKISGLYEKAGFEFLGNDHDEGRFMIKYLEKTA